MTTPTPATSPTVTDDASTPAPTSAIACGRRLRQSADRDDRQHFGGMSLAIKGLLRRAARPAPTLSNGRGGDALSTAVAEDRRQTDTPLHFRRIELKYVLPERLIE